jgi:hypothetical protein
MIVGKSKTTLEERILLLEDRGVGLFSHATIADIVPVVGDLTVSEFHELLSIWKSRVAAQRLVAQGRPTVPE